MRITSYEPTIADPYNHFEVIIWGVEGVYGNKLRMTAQWGDEFKRIELSSFGESLTIDTRVGDGERVFNGTIACKKG